MDFDKLEIKIEADSTKATSNVDQLGKSLRDLNTDLKNLNTTSLISLSAGVKQLSDSMSLLSPMMKGKGNDFTTLSTRLSALANNTNPKALTMLGQSVRLLGSSLQTMSSASGSTVALSSLAKSLSSLGYDSTTRAIANLPLLTRELANMITTLSKLPVVNGNIQKLIASIAALSKQGAKVGSAGRSMASSFNSTGLSLKNLRFRFLNISRIIGTVYANIWLLIRAVKSLSGAVRSAMGYGETLNYFEKAFDDIAMRSTKDWSELGYESATEYYKALSDTLKKEAMGINEQLTGMTNNGKGYKVSSGKNLGLNTTDTLKAQTKFAQMSASMGVATENATMLSNVMTKLGGDLASLYDTDFNTVWGNLQSGITGMSRTMDKYGVNIRNANLNQELMNLGINTTVDKLGQEDKVLLRTIVMLRGTTAAWGDLAETQDSSANQLRILQSNWQKLSSIIGSMFIPVLKAVLPIANAVLVALQRLAAFVANLFGIDADFGSTIGSGVDDMSDYFDDMADSAGGASGAVKKLKNQLLGIDELNVISTPDDGGGAGGAGGGAGSLQGITDAFNDATKEYLDAWNTAFENMEDRISKIADTITNSEAFKTLRELFIDIKDGDWSGVGQDISKLFTISVDGITDLLKSVDWKKIGKNIGDFLSGLDWTDMYDSVSSLIETIFDGAIKLWTGSFNEAPLTTALITLIAGLKLTGVGSAFLDKLVAVVTTAILGFNFGKAIGENLFPDDASYYEEFDAEDFWTAIFTPIFDRKTMGKAIRKAFEENLIVGYILSAIFPPSLATALGDGLGEVLAKAEPARQIADAFGLFDLAKDFKATVNGFPDAIKISVDGMKAEFDKFKFRAGVALTYIKLDIWSRKQEWANAVESFKNSATESVQKFKDFFNNRLEDLKRAISTFCAFIKKTINDTFGIKTNFNFKGLEDALVGAVDKIQKDTNSMLDGILAKLAQINGTKVEVQTTQTVELFPQTPQTPAPSGPSDKSKTTASTLDKLKTASAKSIISGLIPKKATGGYVDDRGLNGASLFYAGERGVPEMLGTVSGRNAVVGGQEITGISDTIRSTSSQEMDLLRQQNELLMAIVNKPFGISESEIFNSVRNSASNYTRTTGRLAF